VSHPILESQQIPRHKNYFSAYARGGER
jgi:hypothetical protein